MLYNFLSALTIGICAINSVYAMDDTAEGWPLEKTSKTVSVLISNEIDKVTFSNQDYPLPLQGDLGTLTNLRFRLIPGAITGNRQLFIKWMNYNSPFNPSVFLPSAYGETRIPFLLRDPMAINLSSNEKYKANDHPYKDSLPDDISITDDMENSSLLTVIYSFDAPQILCQLSNGIQVKSKYCYSRTFTLGEIIGNIENITLSFSGFQRGIDKPSLSVVINEGSIAEVSGYTQNYSQVDVNEIELDTGTFAWAGELALVFRKEYLNKNKEKLTEENFITFLKAQFNKGNTLNYNPKVEFIQAAVEALGLF